MRLTLHTDFALRVLIQVGLNDGKLTMIKDIAQTFGISKAHLMKVVNNLSQKGYLDTVRGRNGGIRLMQGYGADYCLSFANKYWNVERKTM
jgi:Rrf2 family nitric oxide-sensitive transcriptional repressor